jgi:DNA polymerase
MDEPTRNRIGLWLRGERAFGLTLVGRPGRSTHGTLTESAAVSMVRRPPEEIPARNVTDSTTEPAAVTAAPPGIALFADEGPAPAPAPVEPPLHLDAPVLPLEEKRRRLTLMNQQEVSGCQKCRLHETRTNTVFGEGDPDAAIFFIGEGPGETEDLTGRPFVGRAGELLNKQIAAMGLRREQVFIANIVKCRPPGNRVPAPDEVATCTPYLERQLEIVRPKVIVTLGLPAAKYMLKTSSSMGRLRGQWQDWRGIRLMPTYHPSFLLRSPTYENRSAVWSDLQKVMAEVGLPAKKP